MQVSSDSVVEEVHAVILGVLHTFTLDGTSNGVHDAINIFSGEEISDLTRRQKIIEVNQESLVGNLTFSEEEHDTFISDTRFHVELLEIGFKITHTVSGGDHDADSGV